MKRWIALAAAAAVVVTPTAAFAGGYGKKPEKPTKVELCHKPGTPAEKTLTVPSSAVPGHLGHGDYLGACKPKPEPTPEPEPTEEPTVEPTTEPTVEPTTEPTVEPEPTPTPEPEPEPTQEPEPEPTVEPTTEPSEEPTGPSEEPSEGPSEEPTPGVDAWTLTISATCEAVTFSHHQFKVSTDPEYRVDVNGEIGERTPYVWGETVTVPAPDAEKVTTWEVRIYAKNPALGNAYQQIGTRKVTSENCEPTPEPTEPTEEPTDDPTEEPEPSPVAVVAGPTLPTGSIWHDCEIGWTYDLDAAWDDEFTTITFLDPNGHSTNGDDGAREAGPWKAVSSIREGKTYEGIPVRGFAEPLEDGWYVVDTDEDGYVTRIAADFEVEFPWPDEDCASVGEPGGPVLEPGPVTHRGAPDPTLYVDDPGTNETLADTGSEVNVLGAIAGAVALAAGLALGYLGLGRRSS